MLDFDMFIEETAYHIIAHGDMKTKDQYVQFGRRLWLLIHVLNSQDERHHG